MEYRQFFDALFTLVDLWTTQINGEEYIHFLTELFTRVTVNIRLGPQVRSYCCAKANGGNSCAREHQGDLHPR